MFFNLLRNIVIGSLIGVLHLGSIWMISWPILPATYLTKSYVPSLMGVTFIPVSHPAIQKIKGPVEKNPPPVPSAEVDKQPAVMALQHAQTITRDLLEAAVNVI
jgi:hypothetical protein